MDNNRMLELCAGLEGISKQEWKKLSYIINQNFHNKMSELEPQLKLTHEDAKKTISQQFGCE